MSRLEATGNAKFDAWLRRVDGEVGRLTGLSLDDLPDINTRDMFEDGVAPGRVARKAIREAGGM